MRDRRVFPTTALLLLTVAALLSAARAENGEGFCSKISPTQAGSGDELPGCGLAQCKPESELIHELQTTPCNFDYSSKVTLVVTAASNPQDGTFNSLAIDGAQAACRKELGCCLEVDVPNTVGFNDYTCELEYAAQDSHLTVGVGFLQAGATHRAASCFPQTSFAAIDVPFESFPNNNLEGVIFADDEAGYVAGTVAGLVAATLPKKKVGIVSGPQIPPLLRFTTGFANAVASACPDCEPTVIKVGQDFNNLDNAGPVLAAELIKEGAGVIFGAGGTTGSFAIRYASLPTGMPLLSSGNTCSGGSGDFVKVKEGPPAYVVGVDTDEFYTTFQSGNVPGANMIITSAIKQVEEGVRTAIGNYLVGSSSGRNFKQDLANGGVGFAGCNQACSAFGGPVTPDMLMVVEQVKADVASGRLSTRTDPNGLCTAGPGPGCPAEQGEPGPDILAIVLGCVFGFLALIAAAVVVFMVVKERAGNPVFKPLVEHESTPPKGNRTSQPPAEMIAKVQDPESAIELSSEI